MAQTTNAGQHTTETTLRPFTGRVLFGIAFESGHSLWLYDFEATPTGLGGYREAWVVEPDDTRTLYYDTEGADVEIGRFHEWDAAVLAEMNWTWTDDRIEVWVSGEDGTEIVFEATVGDSVMSRVFTILHRYLPGSLHRRMWGRRTETGTLGHLRSQDVRVVTEATARIDGLSLGAVRSPVDPVTFGEVRAFDHPFVFTGDLSLEYPVG
jgi:hypothetical protein